MRSKQEMYPIVELWYKSSLLKRDFCKQHKIKTNCLSYWITKYRKEKHTNQSLPSDGFIPLTIKESVTREAGITPEIELDLPHGIRLRIF